MSRRDILYSGGLMKPLLLLDVDGVLNCFGSFWSDYEGQWEHFFEAEGFPLRIPQGTNQRIIQLREHFEPVWATTWEHRAHPAFGERLGLGESWPVVEWKNVRLSAPTWKLSDVQRYLGECGEPPAAWVDDDLHHDAYDWAKRRTELGPATLLVRPKCSEGMTDEHVAELIEWAEELNNE